MTGSFLAVQFNAVQQPPMVFAIKLVQQNSDDCECAWTGCLHAAWRGFFQQERQIASPAAAPCESG
jgi:hypothetical protein